MYKPCRVRKRKGGLPANELEQVNATLSEYDQRMLMHVTTNKDDTKKDEGLDFLVSAIIYFYSSYNSSLDLWSRILLFWFNSNYLFFPFSVWLWKNTCWSICHHHRGKKAIYLQLKMMMIYITLGHELKTISNLFLDWPVWQKWWK